jgi:two-component sensor histidine kinase
MKSGILFILFLSCMVTLMPHQSMAQKTNGTIALANVSEDADQLKSQLNTSKNDTNKVRILIKLATIEWRISTGKPQLDSCLAFASEAMAFSQQLHYAYGFTESALILCKVYLGQSDINSANHVLQLTNGEERIRLLLLFAEHYIFMGSSPDDQYVNQAENYLTAARQLANQIRSEKWTIESQIATGKFYFAKGNLTKGKTYFFGIIRHFQAKHEINQEAHWWSELAIYMPSVDSNYYEDLKYYQHAIDLFLSQDNKAEAASTMGEMASLALYDRDLDRAEQLYLHKITLLKASHKEKFYTTYTPLADIYLSKGNLDKALEYALLALKNIEHLKKYTLLASVYASLGDIYRELNDIDESCRYYSLCLDQPTDRSLILRSYYILRSYVQNRIRQGKALGALHYTQQYLSQHPADLVSSKEMATDAMGLCYQALGKKSLAAEYFQEVIQRDNELQADDIKTMEDDTNIGGPEAYYDVANFYANEKQFGQSGFYASKALSFQHVTPVQEMNLRQLKASADSASGNYRSAYRDHLRSDALRDSINRDQQMKRISFLKIQFETAQKEKNIALLQKEDVIQRKELEQSAQTKLFSIIGIVAMILVAGVLFSLYRLKNLKNRQLETQQSIINAKNVSLEQLVLEKELLVKEIHHRVKNNLQTVVGLLTSQMDTVSNRQVTSALQESLHRVQAMAMIHQKLYNTTNYSRVGMSAYLSELVDYLKEAYHPGSQVRIDLVVEPISLDLALAVPIGLIVNEALSNTLKYAFPNGAAGKVKISLLEKAEDSFELQIADDGVGLDAKTSYSTMPGFGLPLIRGLAEEIGGQFSISSGVGAIVTISFASYSAIRD